MESARRGDPNTISPPAYNTPGRMLISPRESARDPRALALPSPGGSFSVRAVLDRKTLAPALAALLLAGCADEPSRFVPNLDGGNLDAGTDPVDLGGPTDRGTIPIRETGGDLSTTLVYAHSETVLYQVNPRTNAFTRVGTFTFPRNDNNNHSMNDLAVDADGQVVGNTQDALYSINPDTAACTLIRTLPDGNFVGLTYLSSGSLAGVPGEALVGGASSGTYWRIDPATGRSTSLGRLHVRSGQPNSGDYLLSGDIVSTAAGTFATVRRTNAPSGAHDLLAQMNPANGELTIIGDTGADRIFGLAYYRNTLYGFTSLGVFIRIDVRTGAGTRVSMPTMQFYGAGVTTTVPIEAPP